MTTELKPCPFCGGGAVVSADMTACPMVACDACGAGVSGVGIDGAAAAWNRRVETPDAAEVRRLREEALKDADTISGYEYEQRMARAFTPATVREKMISLSEDDGLQFWWELWDELRKWIDEQQKGATP